MRVRNTRHGEIAGVAPAGEGDVDETNIAVAKFLRLEWLLPVEGAGYVTDPRSARFGLPSDDRLRVEREMRASFDRAWDERAKKHARELSDLRETHSSELASRDVRIAELTERLNGREQELIASRSLVSEGTARIVSLEAEVAQLKRYLDTATAPKNDEPPKPKKPKD